MILKYRLEILSQYYEIEIQSKNGKKGFLITVNMHITNQQYIVNIFWYGVFFNIFLFAFNLLPIPPLDGSHILYDVLPNKFTAKILNLGFYGTFILLIFIYSPLWGFFTKFINFILGLFIHLERIINA